MAENGEMVVHYSRDLEAIALTIVFSNVFFFTLRYVGSLLIAWIFQGKLDNHGEVVSYNNEIFGQHNLGASLFSMSYMLAIYFMIFQADFLGTQGYQVQGAVNMLVVSLTALLAYFLYNLLFMTRQHRFMDELFIDNNSGVGMSLVGFMFAVLHLQSQLSLHFVQEEHFVLKPTAKRLFCGKARCDRTDRDTCCDRRDLCTSLQDKCPPGWELKRTPPAAGIRCAGAVCDG